MVENFDRNVVSLERIEAYVENIDRNGIKLGLSWATLSTRLAS